MLLSLAGCLGLRDYIPEGPVLAAAERDAFDAFHPSGATYTGPARVPYPLPPVQVFGVTYDLDLVIRGRDPRFDMHEIARIITPDGPVWVAKDADARRQQTLTADRDDLRDLLPEVGVPRHRAPLEITEDPAVSPSRVNLRARWRAADGTEIAAHFQGGAPRGPQRKRNSSTMGHSSEAVAVVLDLSHQRLGTARLSYNGQPVPIQRILGLVPVAVALRQTQAGLSQGTLRWVSQPGGARATWVPPDHDAIWPDTQRDWRTHTVGDTVTLEQPDPLRTLRYVFHRVDDALELSRAEVIQHGEDHPAATLRSLPAMPDLRRPFTGHIEGRLVIDVAGQRAHGVARWRARSDARGATLEILPTAPSWLEDRPMHSLVTFSDVGALTAYRMGLLPPADSAEVHIHDAP